jgi:hypothetical protein
VYTLHTPEGREGGGVFRRILSAQNGKNIKERK